MSKEFKVINASGNPYEIGYAHGSQGKEEVLVSINTYKDMFKTYANLDWETAKERSKLYIEHINNYDTDLMDEMRGVADGAGVELEDILALNARSEVIMMPDSAIKKPLDGGCTSMAITPEATKNQDTLLAQNWDWKQEQIDSVLVLKIKQNDKPDITMVTEGGIIGKVGFNSSGIGVCLNALGTIGNPKGLPLHIVLRGILNSRKLSDCVQAINSIPNACAANYLLASSCGEAIDVEKTPTDYDVLYPSNGVLAHSNNFITERFRAVDTTKYMAFDTFLRYGIANKMLNQNIGQIDEDIIKDILRNHKDHPDSICRHNDPLDAAGHEMCTVFSIIMNMTKGKIYLLKGNPCEGEYQEIL